MRKLLLLFLILTLTACSDKSEIEEQAFVIAIGIDEKEGNGVTVTYQIANPQAGVPNAGGEKEEASEIITFNAPDFVSARDLANATVARDVNFSHAKVIIISEKFIKKKEAVKLLTSQIRDREVRRDIKIIISKEKASEFIKYNHPKLETRPHKYFDLMAGRWEHTGLVPFSDFQRLLQRIESKSDGFLIIYATSEKVEEKYGEEDDYLAGQIQQQGGNQTQLIGSAVLKDGVMVGTLTGEETRMSLILRPIQIAKHFRVTYPDPIDPKYRISAQIHKNKNTKIKIRTDKDPVEIDVKIPLNLTITAVPSGINYSSDFENQKKLKEYIEKGLEKKFMDVVKKSQEEFKTNPFNWSHIARRKFLTMKQYEEFEWEKKFLNARVNIDVVVKVSDFGNQLYSPIPH
jgi:spore germination protein KC